VVGCVGTIGSSISSFLHDEKEITAPNDRAKKNFEMVFMCKIFVLFRLQAGGCECF
jgi:hypothetical protein